MITIPQIVAELRQHIAAGLDMARTGREANLDGMDILSEQLHDQVLRMSEAERQLYAADLTALYSELDTLYAELLAARSHLADELRGLAAFRNAALAYRRTDGDKE